MGHLLKIENDEAVALATELAALRGESLDAAVIAALRHSVGQERAFRAELERLMTLTEAFKQSLAQPLPSSSHDWLYDEAGLPA